ncbi:50S ribosomal protein L20 [bacterium]|nr:50S ribosomal protein L20 [bacterium]
MSRVNKQVARQKRHTKYLNAAKGYYGRRSKCYGTAREAVERAWKYAYISRRLRKRDFRRLWIARINAAVRPQGLSYSKFMHGLKLANVELDRKALSYLAMNDPDGFTKLTEVAKESLSND